MELFKTNLAGYGIFIFTLQAQVCPCIGNGGNDDMVVEISVL